MNLRLYGLIATFAVAIAFPSMASTDDAGVDAVLARVKEVHDGAGPWAVVGYRMGDRALKELELPRQSFAISVVHKCPAEVQYSCMADGLQAATGASVGKLNLKVESVSKDRLCTVVRDQKTGKTLTFAIRPSLAKRITDLPLQKLEAEGRRVAELADDEIFTVTTSK